MKVVIALSLRAPQKLGNESFLAVCWQFLETGIGGGVKSPKSRGGGEHFEFSGVPEFHPLSTEIL